MTNSLKRSKTGTKKALYPSGYEAFMVEMRRIELLTYALRTRRSPS